MKSGSIYRNDYVMFSESNSRFIVEIEPENEAQFRKIMDGMVTAHIGHVNHEETLEVHGLTGEKSLCVPIIELKEAWQKPLRW